MTSCDIKNIEAEAGVIASVLLKPDLVFFSEQLKPNHFTDPLNAYVYFAVAELARREVDHADAYNITNILNLRKATEKATEIVTLQALNELFETARYIARSSPEDYKVVADAVLDAAFRRNTFDRLVQCERLCFNADTPDIEQQIYSALDGVMMDFSTTTEIPQYKDVVDSYWEEIESRQGLDGVSGIRFKFPTLNAYATIEPGELFIFGAEAKMGKSMMLLNCTADLLRQGYKVLYLDSELNSRLFTLRMLSHLTGIEFGRIKAGNYTPEEKQRIDDARAWLKTTTFTHRYVPIFDIQSIYTIVKKVYHQQGVDVLVVDYFKSSGDGDAFASYQELGRFVDLVKNQICGRQAALA